MQLKDYFLFSTSINTGKNNFDQKNFSYVLD